MCSPYPFWSLPILADPSQSLLIPPDHVHFSSKIGHCTFSNKDLKSYRIGHKDTLVSTIAEDMEIVGPSPRDSVASFRVGASGGFGTGDTYDLEDIDDFEYGRGGLDPDEDDEGNPIRVEDDEDEKLLEDLEDKQLRYNLFKRFRFVLKTSADNVISQIFDIVTNDLSLFCNPIDFNKA